MNNIISTNHKCLNVDTWEHSSFPLSRSKKISMHIKQLSNLINDWHNNLKLEVLKEA